jgi:hypothetical protein
VANRELVILASAIGIGKTEAALFDRVKSAADHRHISIHKLL